MKKLNFIFIFIFFISFKAFALDVAVIGAGASGLTAAHYLAKQGHKVTVFEKNNRVGGKVYTTNLDATTIELGGLLVTPGFVTINELIKIYGPRPRVLPSKIQFLNKKNQWRNFKGYSALGPVRTFIQYKRLMRSFKRFPELNTPHLVSDIHPDLFMPLTDFARKYGFYEVLPPFVMSLSASGYLFPEIVPAYYALKLFKTIAPVGIEAYVDTVLPFSSPYINGLRYFKGGFTQLWENVAKDLDVRLEEEVISVRKGQIETSKGIYSFDRVVVSVNPQSARLFIDKPTTELETFASNLKKHRFLVTAIKTYDLPKSAHRSYFFYKHMSLKYINHIQSMVNFWDNSKLYVTYQTLDNEITWEEAKEILLKDLNETLGVNGFEVLTRVEWSYFHHIDVNGYSPEVSEAIKGLQGKDGIYFVGEALNFESTESAAHNAKYVIQKLFN
ncbi:protoporphyrinogen/coproporphyrinogen oxidase [Peredibacter starrii]|uniref:FAD-dependent oxidoreductase n=1 Tax=Peredibacter starrii TaxID=28202 RepID=A0AAX4HU05_9BACT|nr:FAD-dependent oxidoreductase [Peredibacter starrii]WPU66668.1 FAD-dependent oxidoreductase [Peredibacter starrii]